ncbi:MAG: hypothetical protein HKN72_05045 [Gemmatimonadetes bacterium]|nr:hypothetical protein [Gemmatimonadota bacterium]NNF12562.1 hypothetical protein [Gemmatimonadota bacterium]
MTGRAKTILTGRRERMERILDRKLLAPKAGADTPIPDETREHLLSEAHDLYWNELEWEHITDEEALEDGPLVELTFPGLLAYVRGLLLDEVMPDALSPANPRPQVVADLLGFLAERIVSLEENLDGDDASEPEKLQRELAMTSELIDRVLYLYHDLSTQEVEFVESAQAAT